MRAIELSEAALYTCAGKGASGAAASASRAKQRLAERGEKLGTLGDKTEEMSRNAESFAAMCKRIKEQEEKKNKMFGGFF